MPFATPQCCGLGNVEMKLAPVSRISLWVVFSSFSLLGAWEDLWVVTLLPLDCSSFLFLFSLISYYIVRIYRISHLPWIHFRNPDHEIITTFYLTFKNMMFYEIMPFAATWMQLEIIILSEVSQKEKDKYHIHSPHQLHSQTSAAS